MSKILTWDCLRSLPLLKICCPRLERRRINHLNSYLLQVCFQRWTKIPRVSNSSVSHHHRLLLSINHKLLFMPPGDVPPGTFCSLFNGQTLTVDSTEEQKQHLSSSYFIHCKMPPDDLAQQCCFSELPQCVLIRKHASLKVQSNECGGYGQ